ncbi:hypothetical protein M433DRAFT_100970 [Acidomyces richmondensis BFW]|nr:MAG: hypothetical protein FE78DRAFT_164414 [Acidomyces sp. 'richmondensis']KYG49360.1 hypothetical protein M433DRAFT_100970 [Acidomyces richmondensis BFW]
MQATTARIGLRAAAQQTSFRQSAALRQSLRFARRRPYASSSAAEAVSPKSETAFAKFWNSPVGPKTVHFWAPIMKWGLVLAGAADFARPAEQLSLSQNAALMATGAIWTRWCFIIKPRNLFLASVNFLLFCVGATQVTRVIRYQQGLKGGIEEVKEEVKKEVQEVKKVVA